MESAIASMLKLYLPILLSLLALWGFFRTRPGHETGQKTATVTLNPFGHFVDFKITLESYIIIRILLGLAIPAFLLVYVSYDYTAFFPKYITLEVFYDAPGIRQSLTAFSSDELASLSIAKDYPRYQRQYFEKLDAELDKTLGVQKFFSVEEGSVHSIGQMTVVVEKTEGWQNYHVLNVEGDLRHTLELPNSPSKEIYT